MTSRRAASWTGIGTIVALFLEATRIAFVG
jgi:hypothetical protein